MTVGLNTKWRNVVATLRPATVVFIVVAAAAVVVILVLPVARDAASRELDKLNPEAILILLSLLGSVLVGARVSALWNVRQKQKELDLSTAHDFHTLYGEFFAIWKMWRYSRGTAAPSQSAVDSSDRAGLLLRACDVEGRLESIFVRLACERVLRDDDIEDLGRFRQLFQQLREAINANEPLDWTYSEHPDYATFKTLAVRVALLIVEDGKRPGAAAAAESLLAVTSNRWETYEHGDYRVD